MRVWQPSLTDTGQSAVWVSLWCEHTNGWTGRTKLRADWQSPLERVWRFLLCQSHPLKGRSSGRKWERREGQCSSVECFLQAWKKNFKTFLPGKSSDNQHASSGDQKSNCLTDRCFVGVLALPMFAYHNDTQLLVFNREKKHQ